MTPCHRRRSRDPRSARTTSSSSARAALGCGPRSRPRRPGADVGLVCKSLLGKAHTVMAEGGVAAALAPRRRRRLVADPLPRHDGRRQAPQQPADGRAPRDRRRRTASASSSCGAPCSTGRRDGRILQRPFGGHSHPRLAHVGDRTGLEMIRTLQDRAVVARASTVYMECTITRLITGRGRVTRRVRLLADDRPADRLPGQGDRARDRRHRQGLRGHLELVGVQRRRPGAWPTRPAPSSIDMEFVQFHPTGMVWPPGVRGPARHRGRPRRGRDPAQQGRRAVHVDVPARGPPRASTPPTDEEAATWVDRPVRRAGRPTRAGRRSCRPATTSRGRSTPRSREGRGARPRRRLPRHQLPAGRARSGASCRRCTSSSRSWPTSTSRQGRWRSGRRPTTSWAGSGSTPTPARRRSPGSIAAGEVAGGMHGANRLGGNSLSDLLVFGARTGAAAAAHAAAAATRAVPRPGPGPGRGRASWRRRSSGPMARTRTRSSATSRTTMQRARSGSSAIEADLDEAPRGSWPSCARAGARSAATGGRIVQPGLEPRLRARPPADRLRGDHPQRPVADREPRRAQPARLPGDRRRRLGPGQRRRAPGRRRHDDRVTIAQPSPR